MVTSRTLRQQVLQLLCQFDAGNKDDAYITEEQFDEDTSATTTPSKKALTLAKAVWDDRDNADTQIEKLTPQWPIHRQPLVDRNILRLARYEITTEMTPPIVAINEAIELARVYSTEQSAAFINGVLDNLLHGSSSSSDAPEGTP